MSAPHWVPLRAVVAIHDRQISRHGGHPGLRDLSLLETDCALPMNLFASGQPALEDLAAAYAFGLARAHAFVDGNKRTAFVTAVTFLRLNGTAFRPDPQEGVRMVEDLASGATGAEPFAAWLARGMSPIP